MKKLALLLLAAVFVLCLCACTVTPVADPTEAPTEISTEAPTEAPTEDATEDPTEAPVEDPTEAPTEEPTEAPTEEPTAAPTQPPVKPTNPPVQPTNPPVQPTEPSVKPTEPPQEDDEEDTDAVIYTGFMDGREIRIILAENGGSFAAVDSQIADEEVLANLGLTGTLRMEMIQRAKFDTCVVEGSVITLSDVKPGYYTSIKLEGTAAEAYRALLLEQLEESKANGYMSDTEYEAYKLVINGGEMLLEDDDEYELSLIAKYNADKLITELSLIDPDGEDYIYQFEYKDGLLAKQTYIIPEAIYDVPSATITTYYADGRTAKTEEVYSIKASGDTWVPDRLKCQRLFREDGTYEKETYYRADSTRVIEYYENGNTKSAVTTDLNGKVIDRSEFNEDGVEILWVYVNEYGTENIHEYYDNGNLKYELYYFEPDVWTSCEYYENDELKKTVYHYADGRETYTEYYEDGTTKKSFYYIEDEEDPISHIEEEYYPNGELKHETDYYKDGSKIEGFFHENGEPDIVTYYLPDGTVDCVVTYEYTYYSDGKPKTVDVILDGTEVLMSYEYEWYENGEMKKEIFTNASGDQEILEYFENGNYKSYTVYEQGQLVSQQENYENGKTKTHRWIDDEGNIYYYENYEDGTTKYSSGKYADGSESEWEYYPNGEIKRYASIDSDGREYIVEYYENGEQKYEKGYHEDGSYYIETYNEKGLSVRYEVYNAEGVLESVATSTYEYYEDGSVKKHFNYENDVLESYAEYTYCSEGLAAGKLETIRNYYADGSFMNRTECEYYENGNRKKTTLYSGSENALNWIDEYYENGNLWKTTWYTSGNVPEYVTEYDADGNIIFSDYV